MGASFICYGENGVRLKDRTLGMVCSIVLQQCCKLSRQSGEREILGRLEQEIIGNSYCSGYTTVIDLQKLYKSPAELQPLINLIDLITHEIHAFGEVLPRAYLEELPEKPWVEGEIWYVTDITEPLVKLKEILRAHEASSS